MNSHERSNKLNMANLKVNELAKHKSQAPWEPIVRTYKYYESEKWREKLDILRILDTLPYWLINAKWPTLFSIYMILLSLFETKDSGNLRCAINPYRAKFPASVLQIILRHLSVMICTYTVYRKDIATFNVCVGVRQNCELTIIHANPHSYERRRVNGV